ncbi:DUF5753 domain-containing protein [Streptomyces sp. NPDC058548]|uniref:DUF5753 domain-containing protein n=1 Tax=Streptomyces sp. NPDC058548 TaxID=3346545 RepID=UPI003660ADE5
MTQKRPTPSVTRRRVGSQLRRWRGPMPSGKAAKLMGWDSVKLGRIERGAYRISAAEVAEYAGHLEVDDKPAVEAVGLAAEQPNGGGWWAPYTKHLTPAYVDFIELESTAAAVRIHHPALIPGPLQSPGYIRDIITREPISEAGASRAEALVSVRLARQELLTRASSPVKLHATIPEAALHAQYESPLIMREQVRKLIDMADDPNVSLQVIPLTARPGVVSNSAFTVLDYAHPWAPVVSVDSITGGTHTEDAGHIETFAVLFDRIASIALPVEKSRELLNTHLERITP